MTDFYTYAEIVELRAAVILEMANELCKAHKVPVDTNVISAASAEDRLRTYMSAGLKAHELTQPSQA